MKKALKMGTRINMEAILFGAFNGIIWALGFHAIAIAILSAVFMSRELDRDEE